MPGLLRGVARTAVVAGTATAVSNRVSRRQAGRWADQSQQAYQQQEYQQPAYQEQPSYAQPEPPEASTDTGAMLDQLKDLAKLHEQGVLTDEEFAAQKARILGS